MLEVRLLGIFEIDLDGQRVDLPSRPVQSLLAFLILNAHTQFRRENLAGLLWPESSEANGRNNLRQALWRLRKSLGGNFFITDKIAVGFNPHADYRLDVDVLQAKTDEKTPLESLTEAVSAYDGELLPGFYAEWVLSAQERLQAVYEDRMQMLLDRLVDMKRWRETRLWAERWIGYGSIPEPAYRALMKAHAGLGDQAGVAIVYRRCIEALKEDLEIEPSTETRSLFRSLTSGELDLRPEPIIHKSPSHLKLPLQSTPFIGRKAELSQLGSLLGNPSHRLITIVGAGGMGKTCLAVEAAQGQSATFRDGIFFVSLVPLDDPVFIVSQIAEAINFSFYVRDQREHWEADFQIAQLNDHLRDKQMLLLLDNVEHLLTSTLQGVEDWKQGAEAVVAELIRGAPMIKILATSRERLHLQGETVYALDGLDFPRRPPTGNIEDINGYSAVRLFLKSAGQVRPGFALAPDNSAGITEICRLVEGMPLGIKLAAAWVDLLSPAEIVAEIKNNLDFLESNLHDLPPRQRSMRSIFESAWKRLPEKEQKVYLQLSVFRGGFARQAAREIAAASLPILKTLVSKSLLRPDLHGRYHCHELLRQFGRERLARNPDAETEAHDRHCTFFAAFLNAQENKLTGRNQGDALAEIETEIDNVRAAWTWAVARSKFDEIEHGMESLCEFYRTRGQLNEGFETFYPTALALGWRGFRNPGFLPESTRVFEETQQILDSVDSCCKNVSRKQALLGKVLARYARFHCESPSRAWKACQIRQSALAALSDTGARQEMAWVLRYMAHVCQTPRETEILYRKALTLFKTTGDERGIAETLFRLGMTATQQGNFPEARQFFEDSLARCRDLGRRETTMFCLAELGYIQWAQGNYRSAQELCRESLTLSEEIGYPSYRATILRYLSRIAVVCEEYSSAWEHIREGLAIYEKLGLQGMKAEVLGEMAHVASAEGDISRAGRFAVEGLKLCEERAHRRGMIEPLTVLGMAALAQGEYENAEAYLLKALRIAIDFWVPSFGLHALAVTSELQAARDKPALALALAEFVVQHPACWRWTTESIAHFRKQLAAELPPAEVAANRKRMARKNLTDVIAGLVERYDT